MSHKPSLTTKTNRQHLTSSTYTRQQQPPYLSSHSRAYTTLDYVHASDDYGGLQRSPTQSYRQNRNNSRSSFIRMYSQEYSPGDGLPLIDRLASLEKRPRLVRSPTRRLSDAQCGSPGTQGSPNSLLDRLGPQSPSVYARAPSQTSPGSSLLERLGPSAAISSARLVDRIEDVGMEGIPGGGQLVSDRQADGEVESEDMRHGGYAGMELDTSTPPQTEPPGPHGMHIDNEFDDEHSSRASEAHVDALLASVLDMHEPDDSTVTTMPSVPPQILPPEAPSVEPASARTDLPVDQPPPPTFRHHADLIAFARTLLAPTLVENAKRRNPEASREMLEAGAQKLVTDQLCEEFIQQSGIVSAQLADLRNEEKSVNDFLTEHGGGEATAVKRPRSRGSNDGDQGPTKSRRLGMNGDGPLSGQPIASVQSRNEDPVRHGHSTEPSPREPQSEAQALGSDPTVATVYADAQPRSKQAEENGNAMTHHPRVDSSEAQVAPTDRSTDADTDLQDDVASGSHVHDKEEPPLQREASLKLPVPGIWFAKEGRAYADILDFEINVDSETAAASTRWAQRHDRFDAHATFVSTHLLCLPNSIVSGIIQNLPESAPPELVARHVWDAGIQWPQRGTLLVTMNPGDPDISRTFYPEDLEGPLDVTQSIRHGTNTVRILQLADVSGHTFILHAGVPTDEDKRRWDTAAKDSRDWTSFVAKASKPLPSPGLRHS
ncbi:hypothetical protein CERSUDRAFT_117397 [Gelatoporia subvermispora B]|uniref:Uncharacterized protein n=1 Tax=Ceriporiopsis subvermispora (strain B) TaxID=914234 RepID=M2QAC1_CERS8|nr:hypothetical protein CERSUDRAFT_117397 [Gelatoporia subvermispora B]